MDLKLRKVDPAPPPYALVPAAPPPRPQHPCCAYGRSRLEPVDRCQTVMSPMMHSVDRLGLTHATSTLLRSYLLVHYLQPHNIHEQAALYVT